MPEKLEYKVEFVTPAFLGNAEQKGQWRTPPFKALLRRWWRILHAAEVDYDWKELRRREGLLWGNAFLERNDLPENERARRKNGHCRSQILLRLQHWDGGTLPSRDWNKKVHTGKVAPRPRVPDQKLPVSLYLGYGVINQRTRILDRDREPAIAAGESNLLILLSQNSEFNDMLEFLMRIIHTFGAVGSRSNNGWGSLYLPDLQTVQPEEVPAQPLQKCLTEQWPHAFGLDDKGLLIWRTPNQSEWEKVLDDFARIKVEIRTIGKQAKGNGISGVVLLGYPAGRDHRYFRDKSARWGSQIRMKTCRDGSQYYGLIYHLPHTLPKVLRDQLGEHQQAWLQKNQRMIWSAIHNYLDKNLERWGGAA